ncbi:hypothetical protein GGR95_002811 [Sulfitobacter undariae]|uniref:DUF1468 domain-containing protein n=1 Tax=Sulfitobacter undariae TaxID=1563671 RepID=A0A7W6EAP7_9RHOB|nr:tripartite tricarboxylate transporter TctB family protein [Sulfitobacter undariae]MBB3995160.1 hypothetical protein [Sulfitobacter undariae]
MNFNINRGPLLRGVAIVVFFAFVALVLIPAYVPRPAFIPGFAPPPDMWPRTVSITGIVLGLVVIVGALTGRVAPQDPIDTDGGSSKTHLMRFAAVVLCFAGFIVLVPYIGFLLSTALLTGAAIYLAGERRHWILALAISLLGPVLLISFFSSVLGTQFPMGALTKPFGF